MDEPHRQPGGKAKIAEWFGEAPAQRSRARSSRTWTRELRGANHCKLYNAENPAFWTRVYYWNTPLADCGDDRGEVCKDYNDWVSAWTEIKG